MNNYNTRRKKQERLSNRSPKMAAKKITEIVIFPWFFELREEAEGEYFCDFWRGGGRL